MPAPHLKSMVCSLQETLSSSGDVEGPIFSKATPNNFLKAFPRNSSAFLTKPGYFLDTIIKEDLLQPSGKKSVLIREFIQNKLRKSLSES